MYIELLKELLLDNGCGAKAKCTYILHTYTSHSWMHSLVRRPGAGVSTINTIRKLDEKSIVLSCWCIPFAITLHVHIYFLTSLIYTCIDLSLKNIYELIVTMKYD